MLILKPPKAVRGYGQFLFDSIRPFHKFDLGNFDLLITSMESCVPQQSKHLVSILSYVADSLPYHSAGRRAQEIAAMHLSANQQVWDRKFAHNQIAQILRSLAVIESQYPDTDFRPTYDNLRKRIKKKNLPEDRFRSQLRHADLWFTKQTDVRFHRSDEPFKGKFEVSLMRHFRRAGIFTFQPDTPPIDELPQAVDFMGVQFDEGEALIELQGKYHFRPFSRPEDTIVGRSFDFYQAASGRLKYNTSTLFRAALTERLAPDDHIIHIDYVLSRALDTEGRILKTGDDLRYLRSLFSRAKELPPGPYRAILGRDLLIPVGRNRFSTTGQASDQEASPPECANGNVALLDPHGRPHSQSPESLPLRSLSGLQFP